MSAKLMLVAWFAMVSSAVSALGLGIVLAWARASRVAVIRSALGFGPAVLRRDTFVLRLFPWSSYFRPAMRKDPFNVNPPDLIAAIERGELVYLDDLPLPSFLGMTFIWDVLPIVCALLLLGFGTGARTIYDAVGTYMLGVVGPFSVVPQQLDRMVALQRDAGPLSVVGVVAAFVAARQVIEFPQNVLFLVGAAVGGEWSGHVKLVLWLGYRAMAVSWLVGVIAWLAKVG